MCHLTSPYASFCTVKLYYTLQQINHKFYHKKNLVDQDHPWLNKNQILYTAYLVVFVYVGQASHLLKMCIAEHKTAVKIVVLRTGFTIDLNCLWFRKWNNYATL